MDGPCAICAHPSGGCAIQLHKGQFKALINAQVYVKEHPQAAQYRKELQAAAVKVMLKKKHQKKKKNQNQNEAARN